MTTPPIDHEAVNATAEQLVVAGYAALHANNIWLAEQLFRRAVMVDVRFADGWLGLATTQTGARRAMCLRWAAYVDGLAHQEVSGSRTATYQRRPVYPGRRMWVAPTVAAAILLVVAGRDLAYRDRFLPGVAVASIDVGNLPRTVAEAKVGQWEQRIARRPLRVRISDQTWQVPLGSLLRRQGPKLAQAAFAYGHEPALWSRTGTFARAIAGYDYEVGKPEVDGAATASLIAQLAQRVKQPIRDAQLERTQTGWAVTREVGGRSIDEAHAVERLRQLLVAEAWSAQDTPLVLDIAVRSEAPARTQAQLERLRRRLEELRAVPLELEAGGQRWNIERSMLMDSNAAGSVATLQPSPALIAQQIAAIAGIVAVAPQPSQLVWRGDRVQTIVPGRPGREIDRDAAVGQIVAALAADATNVALPLREVPPPPGEAEQLGLVAELGRGESQFLTYTSSERDANVQAGGNDVDGVLLAP
ncbi:MAG: peptidoglycan binding domain-containing protein, partial [Pseudomonadota bacterium]|nr:peptidoglycan binding domain-containing protein [Pseudomonadota bacterium]